MLPAVNKNGLVHSPVGPPRIEPVPEGVSRPLWSVMIPTFNCAKYLRQTLDSVLRQDPGEGQMQIEVVDDCSTQDDPEAVVQETGKGRVAFHRKPKNEGAIANFNTCLRRSRGHLIHILHGDDCIQPGFYDAVGRAQEHFSDVALIATRSFIMDEEGHFTEMTRRLPGLEMPSREINEFFLVTPIQCAGVVVRRCFYEKSGGFRTDLPHAADTEMWSRAVGKGGGVVLPQVLACYRNFSGNDTGRLMRTAENLRDRERLIEIWAEREHGFDREKAVNFMLRMALDQHDRFAALGDVSAARENLRFWQERASARKKMKRALRLLLAKLGLFASK